MVVAFLVISITLREVHAEMVTDGDSGTWIRQNDLLATNMVCCECANHMEEKEYDNATMRWTK